jgi:ethanolamine utilization protein EutP
VKRIILIGKTGCGKTTLIQRIESGVIQYRKTQAVAYSDAFIDTPGEYVERRSLYRALIVTAADADVVGLVQGCSDELVCLPPQIASIFPKDVVGIVSKTDLADGPGEIARAREVLELAGAARIFELSALTGDGVGALAEYLEAPE